MKDQPFQIVIDPMSFGEFILIRLIQPDCKSETLRGESMTLKANMFNRRLG